MGKDRDSYLELVMDFPLASIQSDKQLAEAQAVMGRWLAQGELDRGEGRYLDALRDLTADFANRSRWMMNAHRDRLNANGSYG